MVGARFTRSSQRRPDLRFPFPERFAERLQGQEVTALGRRAKYLLADLSSGEVLVMHLGMSGRFLVTQDGATRVPGEFYYEHGRRAAPTTMSCSTSRTARPSPITTPAASASWTWCRAPELETSRHFAGMGIEPLGNELSGEAIARLFAGQAHAAQGGAPRPAPDRRARQHLCLRGAVPRRPAPGSAGRLARDADGRADARRRIGSPTIIRDVLERGGRGRRLDPARLRPGRRLARLFPAPLPGLRPGGRALRRRPAAAAR